MKNIGQFTPQSVPNGTFDIQQKHGRVLFMNESCSNLNIAFSDGSSFYLGAGNQRMMCVNIGNSVITYKTLSVLNIPCIDAVVVEIYEPSDTTVEQYPAPLVRQVQIGNTVPITGGTALALVNDGNVAPTQIVESTASGDSASSVTINNAGVQTLGTTAHPGSLSVNGGGATTTIAGNSISSGGNIAMNGHSITNTSTIQCNDYKDNSNNDVIVVTPGTKTRVVNATAVTLQVPGGADVLTATNNNVDINAGNGFSLDTITFHGHGTISRTGDTSGTGTGTFNHNLGVSPDFVAITTHAVGSQTVGYDSETSTQIHVSTGFSLAWFAWLEKR